MRPVFMALANGFADAVGFGQTGVSRANPEAIPP